MASTVNMDTDLQPLVAEDRLEAGTVSFAEAKQPSSPAAKPRGRRLAVAGGVAGMLLLAAAAATRSARTAAPSLASVTPHSVIAEYGFGLATMGARMLYNESVAQALAVLAKVSYCDSKPGVYGSAAYSCGVTGLPGVHTACENAGFIVTPGFVRTVTVPGASAIVAKASLLEDKLSQVNSYFLTFRGSLNTSLEGERDHDDDLVPLTLNESVKFCQKGLVHKGLYETWQKLQPGVVLNLPGEALVTCTGHGSGAALCALAMFELKALGYKTMSSYTFSMPAVGNSDFALCFNNAFSGLTPFYRLTHGKDLSCPLPAKAYTHVGAEVHYAGETAGKFSICADEDRSCGCSSYVKVPRPERAAPFRKRFTTTTTTTTPQVDWSSEASCTSALAPEGSFCEFGSFQATCYLGTGFHWAAFGPSLGSAQGPAPVGIASEPPPTPAATSASISAPAAAVKVLATPATATKPGSSTTAKGSTSPAPPTTAKVAAKVAAATTAAAKVAAATTAAAKVAAATTATAKAAPAGSATSPTTTTIPTSNPRKQWR